MDIYKLALLHDLALAEFYLLITLVNVAAMKESEANVYNYIYRLN